MHQNTRRLKPFWLFKCIIHVDDKKAYLRARRAYQERNLISRFLCRMSMLILQQYRTDSDCSKQTHKPDYHPHNPFSTVSVYYTLRNWLILSNNKIINVKKNMTNFLHDYLRKFFLSSHFLWTHSLVWNRKQSIVEEKSCFYLSS